MTTYAKAHAERSTRMVATVVTEEREVVDLRLSIPEARLLRAILRHVSGNPDTTDRGLADNIERALSDVLGPKGDDPWLRNSGYTTNPQDELILGDVAIRGRAR